MPNTNRPEIAYLIQNVLPILASQYDFPLPENEDNTKIDEIPVKMGSGIKKPDVIYYWNEYPVFLVEAKKPNKSIEDAIDQAMSYIRNFPVTKFSKDGIRPRYFAVTIGRNIYFYVHRYEIVSGTFRDWAEKLDTPLLFMQIVEKYGIKKVEIKKTLNQERFLKDFLYELTAIYKLKEKITPDVIVAVSHQILSFLQYGDDYVSRKPYIFLDKYKDRQAQIRQLLNKFDLVSSLGPELAWQFRSFIIRSFQGTNLNQYLTEQCVIAFMFSLFGQIKKGTKVLDFECGSGGFLATAIERGDLQLEDIFGVDIDILPFIISKTYLALYYKITGEQIDDIPVKLSNGLYYWDSKWDLVTGNPAGSSKYEHGNIKKIRDEGLEDLKRRKNDKRERTPSEYELSIQQAIRSVRIGGKICLILPEGVFSNSQDEFLRKYIAKYCNILAIISLPPGSFKRGTTVKQLKKGAQSASMKMSILYAEKIREVEKNDNLEIDFQHIDYPVFLAYIDKVESISGEISDWLEERLSVILEQWQEWQNKAELKDIKKIVTKLDKEEKIKVEAEPVKVKKEKKVKLKSGKSEIKISDDLKDIFQ